ncbi:hypothetical protein P7C73_g3818, partial [Tremellales sp. Uapishka_1]
MPTFPVWSALQQHIHDEHPPTCPHTECNGRAFKSSQRLRDHLKVHAEREEDLDRKGPSEEDLPPVFAEATSRRSVKRKRAAEEGGKKEGGKSPKLARTTGEAGKEYACEEEGCDKKFKTNFAKKIHFQASHLKIKVHACTLCSNTYAHKSNLLRHLQSHTNPPSPSPSLEAVGEQKSLFTGEAMLPGGKEHRRFGCPCRVYEGKRVDGWEEAEEDGREDSCALRFWRVYDVRRHLRADHGIDLGDMEVRRLLLRAGERGD